MAKELLVLELTSSQRPALPENRPQVDTIGRYRILSTQNEGGLARLAVRHPPGALDGGLTGGGSGNFWVLASWTSKRISDHLP